MNYILTFVLCQTYCLFRNQLRKLCQCASFIIYMRMASKSVYSQHIRNTTVAKRPWFVYRMIFFAPLMTIAVFSFYYLTCLPLLIPWTIQFCLKGCTSALVSGAQLLHGSTRISRIALSLSALKEPPLAYMN